MAATPDSTASEVPVAPAPIDGASLAVGLAQALVACQSVTPADEGALDVAEEALAQSGFGTQRLVFEAPGTPAIDNLYARFGHGRPCLLFAGHTDVVPPGPVEAWSTPPFGATIRDGKLYGRGAADMKGGVAAMLAAAIAFVDEEPGFAGSIAFLLTGDEEGPAINGTVKVLDWARREGEVFDHCILGEPTNPDRLGEMIKIGRRGSLTGRAVLSGVQGHVAYPDRARNPIDALPGLIAALKAPLDAGTVHFDASNLEFTSVDVDNPASNVIPGTVKLTFNIRFNDLWTPQTLADELTQRAKEAAGNIGVDMAFEPTNAVSFLTAPGPFVDLVTSVVRDLTGLEPALSTTGGTSDARFIKDHCPVIEFGLAGRTMHQVDEHVPVSDIVGLTAIYGEILRRYFRMAGSKTS
jgi:succinyl-diaminopimelate desuccinylase